MIYLDCAATTPLNIEVINEINKFFEKWHNPSSLYAPACDVKRYIDSAREIIAKSIKAKAEEIYFVSSGSEANNWTLQGFRKKNPEGHIFVTNIEHKSIMECVKSINNNVHYINVNRDGLVDIEYLDRILRLYNNSVPMLISIQYANNETGVIQNIADLSKVIHKYNAYFHTDAVQAFPHIDINVKSGIDLMSVSGHKIGCPKGIGFLYIKDGVAIEPLIYGSQEKGLRGGTENVPYIMGMAKGVSIRRRKSINSYRVYFEERLKNIGCKINCCDVDRIENIISCTMPDGIMGELLLYMLESNGIYLSSGSACNSQSNNPSYTLKAIGLSDDEIRRTVRISMPDDINKEMIDIVIEHMEKIIRRNNEFNF